MPNRQVRLNSISPRFPVKLQPNDRDQLAAHKSELQQLTMTMAVMEAQIMEQFANLNNRNTDAHTEFSDQHNPPPPPPSQPDSGVIKPP